MFCDVCECVACVSCVCVCVLCFVRCVCVVCYIEYTWMYTDINRMLGVALHIMCDVCVLCVV